jgi:hypothetical protein
MWPVRGSQLQWPTPRSIVRFEKLLVAQLIKKFHFFYGGHIRNAVLSLSCVRQILPTTSYRQGRDNAVGISTGYGLAWARCRSEYWYGEVNFSFVTFWADGNTIPSNYAWVFVYVLVLILQGSSSRINEFHTSKWEVMKIAYIHIYIFIYSYKKGS